MGLRDSQLGIISSQGHLSGDISVVILGVVQASSGWGPGVLLNVPQYAGQPSTENDPV